MRFQSTPSLSADRLGNGTAVAHESRPNRGSSGQAHRGNEPARNRAEDDQHDDGLVHGHFWAMSSTVR